MLVSPILNIHNVHVDGIINKNSLIPITFEKVDNKIIETTGLLDSGAGAVRATCKLRGEETLKRVDSL